MDFVINYSNKYSQYTEHCHFIMYLPNEREPSQEHQYIMVLE